MPSQEEHDKPENLVESPHQKTHPAESLEEAADSNATLQGYYAMNNLRPPEEPTAESASEPSETAPEEE